MRARVLALAAALLAGGALAGCVSSLREPLASATVRPSEVLHKLGKLVEAAIPLKDGLKLRGTVYLPNVSEGAKVPVVMDLGPYYGNLNPDTNVYSEKHPPNLLYEHFLRRGYAIALVSLRGTGQSEGCFKIGGPEEQADAAAAVEWLAKQPWSDGRVAMAGISYDGTTPWEALVTGTPSLRAIVPGEGITDMYRYTFFDGVPVSNGATFNTYYEPLVDYAYLNADGLAPWGLAQPTNLCPEQAEVFAHPYQTSLDGAHDAYWQARDTTRMLGKAKAATLVVQGFQDWNVRMDEIQDVWPDLPAPKRMLLGQWEHNVPWRNTFNPDFSYAPYNDTITQWLDAFVKDDPAAKEAALAAPPVLAQDSTGRWWNLTQWPPAESVDTPLYLTLDGKLDAAPSNKTGAVAFRTDPTRALPNDVAAAGDACFYARALAGLDCGVSLALQAQFSTPSLPSPLVLMGNPNLTLTVSVDQPGGSLCAVLHDVDPLGAVTRVAPGYLNLAQREGRDGAKEVPMGTPMKVVVRFYGLAHVFQPGHRLLLTLAGNDADVSPAPAYSPTFTVHLAPGTPAVLNAPVFPATG